MGLVAKAPVPGLVKTRLCPPLSPEQAAGLAAALLADTAATALATGFEVVCVATGDEAVIRSVLPAHIPVLRQHGEGLAERLANAHAGLFACGYERVLLVGADCPTVDGPYLTGAVGALDDVDVVLGPAHDGGYTVIGANRPHRALFQGVPMSSRRTAAVTAARCRGAGLSLRTLAIRRDLDRPADLRAALAGGELSAAPTTVAFLSTRALRNALKVEAKAVEGGARPGVAPVA